MTHGRPFRIHRIIRTVDGRALVSGSDLPHRHRRGGQWYHRGDWGNSGAFWKTESAVKNHLRNFCYDWKRMFGPDYARPTGRYYRDGSAEHDFSDTWMEAEGGPYWGRLAGLRVEVTVINDHSVDEIDAAEFMGVEVTA